MNRKMAWHVGMLKTELLPEHHPPLFDGFAFARQILERIKGHYKEIISLLDSEIFEWKEPREAIEKKILVAKNAYIAIDQAIVVIDGIESALKLSPVDVFLDPPRRKSNTGQVTP